MLKKFIFLSIICLITAPQYAKAADWIPVAIEKIPVAGYLKTEVQTDHQGNHTIYECRALLDDTGLYIFFPMNPAYHLEIDITVQNEKYKTDLSWSPITNTKVKNEITAQKLSLEKAHYQTGELLNGYLDLAFSSTELETGIKNKFYVKGPFSAIVRPAGFDPYADENIKTYDLNIAFQELHMLNIAKSVSFGPNNSYTAKRLEEDGYEELGYFDSEDPLDDVRSSYFAAHPQPQGTVLRELTWDINPHAPFSDGPERLTIWFELKNKQWQQAGFAKWLKKGPWDEE